MAQGKKTGGRQKGTPNKASRELKEFLGRVFARAFTEKVTVRRPRAAGGDDELVEVSLEDVLVEQILSMSIDEGLLKTLLAYYAGKPAAQVDHTHRGTVTLAQLIAGTAPLEGDDDPEEDA